MENVNLKNETLADAKPVLADVIKAFACLDDKQECDKQCFACKFVEDGLKKQANVL